MSEENWKQFQGTELGSLLGSIYGSKKVSINYPKIKTQKSTVSLEDSTWRPTINKPDSRDPRKATRTNVDISVPKMKGGASQQSLALIDCIPKRKNEQNIKNEIDEIKYRQALYRPSLGPNRGDAEKVIFNNYTNIFIQSKLSTIK